MTTGPSDEVEGGVTRRLPRSVATLLTALIVGGVGFLALRAPDPLPASKNQVTASPSPSITAWPAGFVTLLPPLCGQTTAQPPCPTGTPAGVYESELSGLNIEHPFTFRLPDGWVTKALPYGNGLDFDAGGYGFSLLLAPRANAADGSPDLTVDARALALGLSKQPNLLVRQGSTVVDGAASYQVDVGLRPGVAANGNCRIKPACYPLFFQYFSLIGRDQEVAAGAIPGRTVRFIFTELPGQQVGLVWIWDTKKLSVTNVVVDSVHFCIADQGCPTVSNPYGRQPPGTTPLS